MGWKVIDSWGKTSQGQFHQPTGAKHKCTGAQYMAQTRYLAQKDAIQFHQQNCNQLY